jgi:hypothetical protein
MPIWRQQTKAGLIIYTGRDVKIYRGLMKTRDFVGNISKKVSAELVL